jgi:RNA polymerase sigma factor (sigma-70 family)
MTKHDRDNVTMHDDELLARRFEANRPRLRAVAYRMLGSLSDAEDAVQEAWLHAAAADASVVANLEGWCTTILARVCLDMLRSRKSRREEALEPGTLDVTAADSPEQETMLADSVGFALLVVLDTLPPAERVAFVLHDTFSLPFDQIAAITGRSPAAARQLASRARRRIQGPASVSPLRLARQRQVAEAFLAASRGGDLSGLLAVLDPDVVLHADATAAPSGLPVTIRGATAVARNARAASVRSRYSGVALVNGTPGIVMASRGRLAVVLALTMDENAITKIDVIADPARLEELHLAVLDR